MNVSPFGSWYSPISSDLIVSQAIGIGNVAVEENCIYWLEKRPTEKGRNVLVRYQEGKSTDVTPAPYNVRTRVHEYGGGAYVIAKETVYFSNFQDNRIYQNGLGETPQPLTPESAKRYADFILDSDRNRLIAVCEDHSPEDSEAINTIVTIDLATGEVGDLISGEDFYAAPRLNKDGTQLAWLSWQHPNMPWDSCYLWLAEVNADGSMGEAQLVAGDKTESICEPKWSEDGRLYFSSDRTNWWNLYRRNPDGEVEILHEMAAEFAYPHWVFGLSNYAFSGNYLVCAYTTEGSWHLGKINTKSKQFEKIDTPYTSISDVQTTSDGEVVFVGGSPTEATAVVKLNLDTLETKILKRSSKLELDSGYLSQPEAIAFPTEDNLTAYAWYYPPQNKDYSALEGELPPLVVKSHGGPTAAASVTLSLKIQYWTSRGFGYLDVNYGGSIGYGREYRQRLENKWGIVDVDDCVNAAKYLVDKGRVDGERLVITGGSAGGYTTLAVLTFRDTFKAGASHYGVSDLEILAKDTHKFESRYLDRLVGDYPQQKEIYQARSPIYHTESLNCPVIFFQGLEDKVVPPNQAEMMFDAIKAKGLPVAYVTFPEEGHGFRSSENIKKALDGEFYFYSRIFGFVPADEIEPVEIVNL
ncbi:S9 family peptidase [Myxosarcina sp. GI1]|uniref:S9 family peptidase n=1 Tax=Myxosarcina sp. GI1 TaxID=1541065 RepID=UPI00056B1344|nr:S9 family peptidase [Myxosarcina sp. GI1]